MAVAGVALSGQMQDTILLNSQGAVGRAILYSDCRAEDETHLLDEQIGAAQLTAISGNPQSATSVLAKWLWLARQAPTQLSSAQTLLLGAHDYITWRLCGALRYTPTMLKIEMVMRAAAKVTTPPRACCR